MKKNSYKYRKKNVLYAEKKPFFADKEIIFRSNGKARVFNISHRVQICVLILFAVIFCWSGYNYHFYHKSSKIIYRKDKELDKTRDAYMDLMSDVSALQNNLKEVVSSVEDAGNGLKEIQEYKEKALVMEDKIKKITGSEAWIDLDKIEDKITKKEALLQKDIALQENNSLKDKVIVLGRKLEKLHQTVKGLETAEMIILDKIERMSGKEIEKIKVSLGKINQTLKIQKQYFNPLANIKEGEGGEYLPVPDIDISDNLRDKMSSVFKLIDLLDKYKLEMSKLPLGTPVYSYNLSSTFGERSDPFKEKISYHRGIDMSTSQGSRVAVQADGKVIKAEFQNNGYGNLVEIRHSNGFMTRYAHLHKMYVKVGDMVKYNQAIGEVGHTGRATGSHLHYEVLYNGNNVNPLTFVNIQSMNNS